MKTKEQILEWLDKQPWKNEFYENHFKHKIGDRICFNENFIRSAFDWPIGGDVWLERENEYLKWYNSNDKPMSWEEYCEQNPLDGSECWIDVDCEIQDSAGVGDRKAATSANIMSKELCEAFVAYMKLIQLRNAWVKYNYGCIMCYRIMTERNKPTVGSINFNSKGLSFADKETASKFLDTFKDLLETAKPLL